MNPIESGLYYVTIWSMDLNKPPIQRVADWDGSKWRGLTLLTICRIKSFKPITN